MVSTVVVVGGGSAGFMAAMALKTKLPELRVRVLRSPDIGIIGVGEGSTIPLTDFLHKFLGLGDKLFLDVARPTWKLGMKFLWGPRSHFFYPFGSQMDLQLPGLSKGNAYYCARDMDCVSPHAAMMAQEKIFARDPNGMPVMHRELAYHFENERYVEFLEMYCRHVGVEIADVTIRQVLRDERGGVAGLITDRGTTEAADLYVDCSGFRSLLLGQTLQEPFVSYKSSLFCDRAVVGGWARTREPIHPYTTCETMTSGWCWQIEHETRINRGYVYSSAFISDAEAEAEFRQKNPNVTDTRVVKFVSGRYERAWVHNVVGIGNASGFVEPLEATALAVIANRTQLLTEILMKTDRQPPRAAVDLYNRHHVAIWESIRRFLAVHYKYNHRFDTPFWLHCHRATDVAGAEAVVECYQRCGPEAAWAPLLIDRLDVFGMGGYLTMLVGQGVPTERPYEPPEREWGIWNTYRGQYRQAAARAMTVQETYAALRRVGLGEAARAPTAERAVTAREMATV